MKKAGKDYDLSKENLLNDLSNFQGKYHTDKIVYVNDRTIDGDRYAIIALNWKWEHRIYPRLAIRWFHGMYGFPHNGSNASWLIIPASLNEGILNVLGEKGVPVAEIQKISAFLSGPKKNLP